MSEKKYFTLPENPTGTFTIISGSDLENLKSTSYNTNECIFFNIFLKNVSNMDQKELYSYIDSSFSDVEENIITHLNENHHFFRLIVFSSELRTDTKTYMSYIKDIILDQLENIEFKEPLTPVQCAKLRLKHG